MRSRGEGNVTLLCAIAKPNGDGEMFLCYSSDHLYGALLMVIGSENSAGKLFVSV